MQKYAIFFDLHDQLNKYFRFLSKKLKLLLDTVMWITLLNRRKPCLQDTYLEGEENIFLSFSSEGSTLKECD